eukprot:scaffold207_cov409-Prasinococcus_capsulatus_cf.AAC.95
MQRGQCARRPRAAAERRQGAYLVCTARSTLRKLLPEPYALSFAQVDGNGSVQGSDSVISVATHPMVPCGTIALEEAQRHNLHLVTGEKFQFTPYQSRRFAASSALAGDREALVDLTLEVRLRYELQSAQNGGHRAVAAQSHSLSQTDPEEPEDGDEHREKENVAHNQQQQDTGGLHGELPQAPVGQAGGALPATCTLREEEVVSAFLRLCASHYVAVGELVLFPVHGEWLVARVTEANNLSREDREDQIVYHCFRGRVTTETLVHAFVDDRSTTHLHCSNSTENSLRKLYLTSSGEPSPEQALDSSERSSKANSSAAAGMHTNLYVNVITNDGEYFPVKKKLLRPCIALTSTVQVYNRLWRSHAERSLRQRGDQGVTLMPLSGCMAEPEQAGACGQATGRTSKYDFDINRTGDLLAAANVLRLRGLQELCEKKQGAFKARIRYYSFEEVVRKNSDEGQCLLLLDGMVLDVLDWLSEHPGGNTIIPSQALNKDCSTFFELYHVSRESFMYIKQFYVGELVEEDVEKVPCEHPVRAFDKSTSHRLAKLSVRAAHGQLAVRGLHGATARVHGSLSDQPQGGKPLGSSSGLSACRNANPSSLLSAGRAVLLCLLRFLKRASSAASRASRSGRRSCGATTQSRFSGKELKNCALFQASRGGCRSVFDKRGIRADPSSWTAQIFSNERHIPVSDIELRQPSVGLRFATFSIHCAQNRCMHFIIVRVSSRNPRHIGHLPRRIAWAGSAGEALRTTRSETAASRLLTAARYASRRGVRRGTPPSPPAERRPPRPGANRSPRPLPASHSSRTGPATSFATPPARSTSLSRFSMPSLATPRDARAVSWLRPQTDEDVYNTFT